MNYRSFVCAVLLMATMSLGSAALAVHKSGHKKVHSHTTSQSSKDKAQSKSDATTANKKSDDDDKGRMLDPQSVTGHK